MSVPGLVPRLSVTPHRYGVPMSTTHHTAHHHITPSPAPFDWGVPERLLAAAGIGFELVHIAQGPSCDDCPGALERAA